MFHTLCVGHIGSRDLLCSTHSPEQSPDPAPGVGRAGVEKGTPGVLRRVAQRDGGGGWVGVMVGMGEGGHSPFYILQLPIHRPMAALLVVLVVVVVVVV